MKLTLVLQTHTKKLFNVNKIFDFFFQSTRTRKLRGVSRRNQLCRKEVELAPVQQAPLRCRYETKNSSFLKIAPLKLEEVWLNPLIVVYHDVINDSEIEIIKKLVHERVLLSTNYVNC